MIIMNCHSLFKPPLTEGTRVGKVRLSPGEDIGEHVTENREEIIIVLRGVATLQVDGETLELNEKGIHYIREGKRHNVVNNTDNELEYVYVVSSLN
jgi:quercetin dioxygenase-like cupin family protein